MFLFLRIFYHQHFNSATDPQNVAYATNLFPGRGFDDTILQFPIIELTFRQLYPARFRYSKVTSNKGIGSFNSVITRQLQDYSVLMKPVAFQLDYAALSIAINDYQLGKIGEPVWEIR